MIIFLIGYMGCGKSTLGKPLAKTMGYDFIDSDQYIEQIYNKSVEEIFLTETENGFREKELEFLKNISKRDNTVISTGGGMPCFNNNIDLINSIGISIYIKIPPKTILHRIVNSKKKRPLLQNKTELELLEYIESTLKHRELFYSKSKITIEGISITYKDIMDTLENFKLNTYEI